MDLPSNPEELRARLAALAAFLPLFEEPDFEFGAWSGGGRTESGATTFPTFEHSQTAVSFVDMAYEQGWVRPGLDWPAWLQTAEAAELRDDPAAASADQLRYKISSGSSQ